MDDPFSMFEDLLDRYVDGPKIKRPKRIVPLSEALTRSGARISELCSNEMPDDDDDDDGPSTYRPLKAMLQVMAPNEKHLRKLDIKVTA